MFQELITKELDIFIHYLLQLYLKLLYKPSLSLIETNKQKLQNVRIM